MYYHVSEGIGIGESMSAWYLVFSQLCSINKLPCRLTDDCNYPSIQKYSNILLLLEMDKNGKARTHSNAAPIECYINVRLVFK